jgi:hypothetical protein
MLNLMVLNEQMSLVEYQPLNNMNMYLQERKLMVYELHFQILHCELNMAKEVLLETKEKQL